MKFTMGFTFGSFHPNWRFSGQEFPSRPISAAAAEVAAPSENSQNLLLGLLNIRKKKKMINLSLAP